MYFYKRTYVCILYICNFCLLRALNNDLWVAALKDDSTLHDDDDDDVNDVDDFAVDGNDDVVREALLLKSKKKYNKKHQ